MCIDVCVEMYVYRCMCIDVGVEKYHSSMEGYQVAFGAAGSCLACAPV